MVILAVRAGVGARARLQPTGGDEYVGDGRYEGTVINADPAIDEVSSRTKHPRARATQNMVADPMA